MIRIKDVDSSKLLFDIHSETLEEDMRKAIPEFGEYTGSHAHKVFQYIILMYDMRSPLLMEESDYFIRKYTAANMVSLPKTKQGFTPETENIILGGDDTINIMIVAYLFQFPIPEYHTLIMYDAMLGLVAQKILKGMVSQADSKLLEDATSKKRALTRVIFHSGDYDEYSALRNALYARIEKQRIRMRPEQIIKEYESQGMLPDDFCPYGERDAETMRVVRMQYVGEKTPSLEKRKRGRPKKQI
jgi:hypothetical protein